jgi:glycosyltransferase involved in cell wall biosynthesis
MSSLGLLSIIVCHHNRPELLTRCIDALRHQTVPTQSFEIIVVDDNSTPEDRERAAFAAEEANAAFVPNTRRPFSAAAARNCGAAMAQYPWWLFLDCDCIAAPNLLEKLMVLPREQEWVDLLPTIGSSLSQEIQGFVLGPGLSDEEVRHRLSSNALAKDSRLPDASGRNGAFTDHPAPWVYCWTTGVLLHGDLVSRVGGFDESFRGKGSEDIAFGYALHRAGARFRMPPVPSLIHTPHARNRSDEERRDRDHERILLRSHPCFEIELLCAFDASNTGAAFRHLEPISRSERALDADISAVDWAELRRDRAMCVLGPLGQKGLNELRPNIHCDLAYMGREGTDRYSLLGLALPFEDKELGAILMVDMRQLLPESLICRIFQESHRTAHRVFYFLSECTMIDSPLVSSQAATTFDRPYWERTCPLSRSYHDWRMSTVKEAPRGLVEITPAM